MRRYILLVICMLLLTTANFAGTEHHYITVGEKDHSYVIDASGNTINFESIKESLKDSFYYENTIFPEAKIIKKEMNGHEIEQMIYLFGMKNYKEEVIVDPIYDKIIANELGYLLIDASGTKQIDAIGQLLSSVSFDIPKNSRITDVKKDAYIYELANGAQGRIGKNGEVLEYAEAARITYLDESIVHYHVNMGLSNPEMQGVYGVQLKDVSNGQTLVDFEPGTMGHKIGENLFAGRNSRGEWYLIDYDGGKISKRKSDSIPYVNIGKESDGLISFAIRSESGAYLWGYMDRNEDIKIQAQFTRASEFSHDFAIVDVQGKKGLINKNGRYVILPELDRISVNRSQNTPYYSVQLGDYSGLMNADFEWVVRPNTYTYATLADEGIYVVKKISAKYSMGLLNHQGKIIIPCDYTSISKLDKHLFIVEKDGVSHLYDKETERFQAFDYKVVRTAGDGYIAVSMDGKKWGLADSAGKLLTEIKFDRIGMFRDYSTQKLTY